MTNEFVIGQNRYRPLFGQPASLDKISLHRHARWTTRSSITSATQRMVSTWQFVDNFAYFRGTHNFKFGFNLRRVREEDMRGSVAGLNATEEVNFSHQHQHCGSGHVRPARRHQHRFRPRQFPVATSTSCWAAWDSSTAALSPRATSGPRAPSCSTPATPSTNSTRRTPGRLRPNLTVDIGLR